MRRGLIWLLCCSLLGVGCSSTGVNAPTNKPWQLSSERQQETTRVPAFMKQQPKQLDAVDPVLLAPQRAVVRGVPILVVTKRDLPLVSISVLINVGVVDEPAPGVACATAEMLDEGAGRRDALTLAAAFAQLGSRPQIDCGWDYTSVRIRLLRRQLEPALPLLFDLLRRPRFRPADLKRTLGQLEARALARRSVPSRVAQLALRRGLFAGHPYSRPPLALPRQLRRLRRRALKSFHRRYYRRGRIAVVVAGDVQLGEAVDWLRPHLARLPGGARRRPRAGASRRWRQRRAEAPRLILVDRPGASQSVLRLGAVGPSRGRARYAALRLINVALGGSFTSRLNLRLRERQGLTYGAFSALWFGRQASIWWAGASVKTSVTVQAAEQMLAEIGGTAKRGLTSAELGKARQVVLGELAERFETVQSIGRALVEIAALDLSPTSLSALAQQARAASTAELQQVAQKSALAGPLTLVVVGDIGRVGAALRARFGRAVQVDLDGLPVRRREGGDGELAQLPP